MPAFADRLSLEDRWALALFASGLRYSDAERSRVGAVLELRALGVQLTHVDGERAHAQQDPAGDQHRDQHSDRAAVVPAEQAARPSSARH